MRPLALSLSLVLLSPALALAQASATQPSASAARALSVEERELHDSLHLTAAQEEAWRTYMAALGSTRDSEARRRAAQEMMPTLTTPRRIALIEANLASDAAELKRQGQAVIAFYNQLTPAQQQTFDRLTLPEQTQVAARAPQSGVTPPTTP